MQQRTPGLEYFVAHSKGQLNILTNAHGAANYQLMTAPVAAPGMQNWQSLVPERANVAVQDLEVYASKAVLYERHHGQPAVSVLDLQIASMNAPTGAQQQQQQQQHDSSNGGVTDRESSAEVQCQQQCQQLNLRKQQQHQQQQQQQLTDEEQQHQQPACAQLKPINIPSWATSVEPGANPDYHTSTVRLHAASPVHPRHVFDYHLDTGQLQLLGVDSVAGHDPDQCVCRVQHATSADGTQVRMPLLSQSTLSSSLCLGLVCHHHARHC